MARALTEADFTIHELIGTGSFSTVFHATDKKGRHYALKRLFWNNAPDRILKELQWICYLDHPNIVKCHACFRTVDQATLVMEYIPHIPFRQLLSKMNNLTIQHYMYGLLSALAYMHSKKIIHRDVKPANFLFDPKTMRGVLIDFGLCEEDMSIKTATPQVADSSENDFDLQFPHLCQNRQKMMANRAGTRGFRSPEVLFAAWNQTLTIDIWSAGVVLLSILSQRYPFFKSPDDLTSLCEISVLVGTEKLYAAAKECGRKLRFPVEQKGYNMQELCTRLNSTIDDMNLDPSVFDLLEKMLEPIPSLRITSEEALKHPFFATISAKNA
ncbi:CMGC family protein kinase [Trichomonas vaginalis G3]|uniref:non-specific serine/threonine protein kinase n=1 Tax=Trichomonas vaginalis (strain ATCC PRA-98 / G3) TaxID=412133 RepID=A2DDY4_TRIV3|nr:cell division cycle [Trichomonas vaginalis G3]EAY21510.1 CMGC family protein kinase [Trichomonas vaginalis G3]KAI5490726.1 cell division cycle [Trichomonas vaginalis G3]|eukprot:XP_001582496.1 CMGC family protein kinase [Trichomonas vaginalis G3]